MGIAVALPDVQVYNIARVHVCIQDTDPSPTCGIKDLYQKPDQPPYGRYTKDVHMHVVPLLLEYNAWHIILNTLAL